MDIFYQNDSNHQHISSLLQDFSAFETTFLPPYTNDQMNDNECIDMEYLDKILNTEMVPEDCAARFESLMSFDVGISQTNYQLKIGENVKNWVTRKRYKKGSPEAARQMAENKIKNRVAAAQAHERKKAYEEQLKSRVLKLRKRNENLKKWKKEREKNAIPSKLRIQLRRTSSGPL